MGSSSQTRPFPHSALETIFLKMPSFFKNLGLAAERNKPKGGEWHRGLDLASGRCRFESRPPHTPQDPVMLDRLCNLLSFRLVVCEMRGCYLLTGWCGDERTGQVPGIGGRPEGGWPCQKASDHFTHEIRDGVYFPGKKREEDTNARTGERKKSVFVFNSRSFPLPSPLSPHSSLCLSSGPSWSLGSAPGCALCLSLHLVVSISSPFSSPHIPSLSGSEQRGTFG